ncbi:MAG: hypothetical protein Q8O41_07795 [Candidatus Methanoperedens sp.]|nr:hypothetical protein [Candidatus Methanoperedens sp.]
MGPKNKTLIPLIIIFFIFGAVVGYVAHKPATIEKIVEKEKIVTVTVTVTPIQTPTPTPTLTPTPIATAAPTVIDFTVKNYYDPAKDISTYTIQIRNWGADPNTLSVHQGDSVLIKIADITLLTSMTLILNSSSQKEENDLGTSGAAFVTFNKKGIYTFKGILRSSDPTILSRTYAEGTISVY